MTRGKAKHISQSGRMSQLASNARQDDPLNAKPKKTEPVYLDLNNCTVPPFIEKTLPFFQQVTNYQVKTEGFKFYIGTEKEIKLVNPSELWFVLQLERFEIPWEYEPVTFVFTKLATDKQIEGPPAFCPDIYIPEQDLYVELTLKAPKYMSHKLKKINRLKDIEPNTKVSLVGRIEFLELGQFVKDTNKAALVAYLRSKIK